MIPARQQAVSISDHKHVTGQLTLNAIESF
jgi:hypothetical protein